CLLPRSRHSAPSSARRPNSCTAWRAKRPIRALPNVRSSSPWRGTIFRRPCVPLASGFSCRRTIPMRRPPLWHWPRPPARRPAVRVAEISAHGSECGQAAELMYGLARETSDPRIAKRAFRFAMAAHDLPAALRAARQWVLVSPNDPDAVASSLALAASNGQTAGLAGNLRKRIESAKNKEQAIAQAASIVSKMSDKQVAYQVLDQALPESVRSLPLAQLALADAAWAAGDAVDALEAARAALKLAPNSEMAAQRVLEYGLQVDSRAAIRETEAYVERYPDMRRLRLLLVNRLVGRHEFDAALAQVQAMRQRAPED